MFSKKYL